MTEVVPFGDRAFQVSLGEAIDADLDRRARVLADLVVAARRSGQAWGAPVPAHASVLVPFDPDALDPSVAEEALRGWLARAMATDLPAEAARPPIEIPVRYGGADGPDLPEVAERLGIGEPEVVELHAGTGYRVLALGFAPGFAYLGVLPAALELPRRAEPRTRVPPGSVAIAVRQTAVYPLETAGGWHLIGRTDVRPWDLGRDPPALLASGDRVRFVPERRGGP